MWRALGPKRIPCPRWIRGRRHELCLQPFGLLSAPQKAHADVLTLKGASYRLRNRGIDTLPSIRTQDTAD